MAISKRLLRSGACQSALAWLAAQYLRLVYRTTRWTIVRPPATERLLLSGQPYLACFWHGRMLLMRRALPEGSQIHILISQHRDGALIARAVTHLGIATVAGSTKRGVSALRGVQRVLSEGHNVAVTPDGPRGPRMRAKPGAIKAAQLGGVPVIPVSGAVSRRRVIDSWDRFCLVLPFGRAVIQFGEPIEVPRTADEAEVERLRHHLEEQLNSLTAQADQRFGLPLIEPAPEQPDGDGVRHARA